jgi:hypothetical protein
VRQKKRKQCVKLNIALKLKWPRWGRLQPQTCHIFGPRGVGASQSMLLVGTYSSRAKSHAATLEECAVIVCASARLAKERGYQPTVPCLR